jgi:hypothetical protein
MVAARIIILISEQAYTLSTEELLSGKHNLNFRILALIQDDPTITRARMTEAQHVSVKTIERTSRSSRAKSATRARSGADTTRSAKISSFLRTNSLQALQCISPLPLSSRRKIPYICKDQIRQNQA